MPKKSTKNLREPRLGKRLEGCKIPSSDAIVKQFRSIHVNVKNAKRWFMLKKRLALVTDDELISYLLDLAEPIIRRDGKCSGPGDWKMDQDKENDLDVIKIEEKDLLNVEEPLRRSPRKQCIVPVVSEEQVAVQAESTDISKSPQTNTSEIVQSENQEEHAEKRRTRIKHHHKNKEKHHKDKRTRRKHSKNNNGEEKSVSSNDEDRSVLSRGDVEESQVILNNRLPFEANVIVERLTLHTKHTKHANLYPEGKKSPIFSENVETEKKNSRTITNDNLIRTKRVDNDDAEEISDQNKDHGDSVKLASDVLESKGNTEDSNDDRESESVGNVDSVKQEIAKEVSGKKKPTEDKRSKKRRKHGKHELVDNGSKAVKTDDGNKGNDTVHKRRKKKHKRDPSSTTHRTKKFHDVRKAPQDGLVEIATSAAEETIDPSIPDSIINDSTTIESNILKVQTDPEEVGEPHRLAIKIKLCQNCNDRHVKDTCPLTSTEDHVKDRVSYEEWLTRHKSNAEMTKAISTEDPISEGYTVASDENFESDEETPSVDHTKNKMKTESEDKQLHMSDDRPLYSRESLPDCFELKLSNPEHGVGIYAIISLPMYTKFGPLVGNPIKEMDIPDDFSMRHLWEIDNEGKISYISTTNPLKSNWIRYVRPADTKEDRNMTVVTKNGELYLVTTQNITKGTELTYWADSQSSALTRKNKIDKTNCGGCNLNFTHSIYYRLHCCIFHDTRYSLTIRKYHCKVCGAAVLGKDNIMKHAADLHGGRGAYQCQYCRKFFLRLNYLEMHRTYGCSQNPQRSRPLCDFCGRKFCQPQKLKVHIKRMHNDMSEVLREFQCKICLKLLGSRAALQRHMKEVHHKDVVGAATCDRCGKMFQNKSNLKIHMLTHSGVKPFKCKETDCKAAFTTKQCLQFHYKKVHGLSEDMMPKIERSVAYTFDAYSGGLVEGLDQEKKSRTERKSSQQENSNSAMSIEDCSSEHSSRIETSINSFQPTISEFDNGAVTTSRYNLDRYILDRDDQGNSLQEREIQDPELQDCEQLDHREMQERELQEREIHEQEMHEREMQDCEIHERHIQDREIQEHEIQDREIQQSSPSPIPVHSHQEIPMTSNESSLEHERTTTDVDFYGTRLQSKGSKKWMGQYNSLNEPEIIPQHHNESTSRADVYEFSEASIKKSEDRNDGVSNALMSGSKLSLNIYRRPESTNASLLVEAALDAAERDIGAVTSPIIDDSDRESNIYTISSQLQTRQADSHLDSYMQQQDELLSPSSVTQDNRKTPNPHVHIDYHLHRPVDYINSPRTHSIEQYLPQDDLPRVGSPGSYNIHMQQDDLTSPSATPNQNRYQDIHHHHHHHHDPQQGQHHHQGPADNLSSDEGDSVAQNLSTSVKEKSLQLDLSTSYKYEQLDPEFNRERASFEPLILNNGELQGLDMSARGFHHALGSQISNSRYHPHLYEITERQSVDLSRTGYSISPPPSSVPPPPYPHSEVLRVVSLDLTPGHSVDLSLSRSHHLHSTGSRIITGSPQPPGSSASHVVPENVEGRILSSPPPSITSYNSTYPVSPAPYHPPRPGYHHYSGYY